LKVKKVNNRKDSLTANNGLFKQTTTLDTANNIQSSSISKEAAQQQLPSLLISTTDQPISQKKQRQKAIQVTRMTRITN
jgi:hypothetical protein